MDSTQHSDQYRFERKFVTTDTRMRRADVESLVRFHPAMFKEVYYRRWVNNIYLDSWTMESYMDSGESEHRVKTRVRWYGSLWGRVEQPILELKIKRNMVNRKVSYPLGAFTMSRGLSAGSVRELIGAAAIPGGLRDDLLKLEPTLVNRYSRNYFVTADRAFRITIDSDVAFHACDASRGMVDDRWCEADHMIVELKYAQNVATKAHHIVQMVPLRLSRSSKYVTGIEATRYRFGFAGSSARVRSWR